MYCLSGNSCPERAWLVGTVRSRAATRSARQRPILKLEQLEDRQLLATGVGSSAPVFVGNLYQDLLHRAPEPAGLTYWMALLDQGSTPATVANGIANSTEARRVLIDEQYQTLLHREGESAGVAYWQQYLAQGGTAQGLTISFLASPEYAQKTGSPVHIGNTLADGFLFHLYTDVLGRTPPLTEMKYWSDGQATPSKLPDIFVSSPEAQSRTVNGWYQTYLHRPADAASPSYWQAFLAQGMDARQLLGSFLGTAEYVNQSAHAQAAATSPAAGTPAEAINRLASDLYGLLASQDGNFAFSPVSIEAALAMAYAGARGSTADEMAAILHLGPNTAATHDAVGTLLQQLVADGNGEMSALSTANALWGQSDYPFKADFLQLLQSAYGTAFQNADFRQDPEQARAVINDWVTQHTHDRIQNLFPSGTIDELTRLVLANAVYFHGEWLSNFETADTQTGTFTIAPGQTVSVSLMHMSAELNSGLRYGEQDGVQTLEMPYKDGKLAMDVFLPEQVDGLSQLESQLSTGKLTAWTSALDKAAVVVTLPRFKTTTAFDLTGVLGALGMRKAFDPNQADFSGLNGGEDVLSISHVLHKAFVNVDEAGTEAAAATGITFQLTSAYLPPTPPVVFRADHPFVYVIRDTGTNTVLFAGRVSDPSQTA